MRTIKLISLSLVLAACLAPLSAFTQEYCKNFVVLDQNTTLNDHTTFSLVHSVICDATVHNVQDAHSRALTEGVSVPVDDVLTKMSFDGKTADSSYDYFQHNFCALTENAFFQEFSDKSFSSTLSKNSTDIVQACFRSSSPWGYFDVTADGSSFAFNFNPGVGTENIVKATFSSSSPVVCSPNPKNNPFGISANQYKSGGKPVSGKPQAVQCAWKKNEPVSIWIELSNYGSVAYMLPARPVETVTPPPIIAAPAPPLEYHVSVHLVRNLMKGIDTWATPPDEVCTFAGEENVDGFFSAGTGDSPGKCPFATLKTNPPGGPGQNGVASTGDFDPNSYSDNFGYCAYALLCHKIPK